MGTNIWKIALVAIVVVAPASAMATTIDEALAAAGDGKYVQVNGAPDTPTYWSITVEFPEPLFPYTHYIWLHFMPTPLSVNFQYQLFDYDTAVGPPWGVWDSSHPFPYGPIMIPSGKKVTRVLITQRQEAAAGTVYLDAVTDGTYDQPGNTYAYYYAHTGVVTPFPETPGPTLVDIDIKPGSYPNTINLGSNGVVPVGILSSESFNATTVSPETVFLAGAGVAIRGKGNKYLAHEEDVNGDGLMDLVVQVETENLDPGQFQDGYAILTGATYSGQAIQGSDEIIIVPP